MAYTNPWNESVPLGSAPRSTVDDIVRALKLDIRERMNAVVVDWAADPVVLQPSFAGEINKTRMFNWSVFNFDVAPTAITDKYVEWDNTVPLVTGYAVVDVPDHVDFTLMQLWYQRMHPSGNGLATGALSLLSYDHGSDIIATVASLPGLIGVGGVNNPITQFTHTANFNQLSYRLKFAVSNSTGFPNNDSFRLYLVSLRYTAHNLTETL